MNVNIPKKDCALVVVDMLYDFIDGSLACQETDQAVAGTLRVIEELTAGTDPDNSGIRSIFPILFIRDHHPANHCSFVEQGGPWPPHCVQGTRGAEIHERLAPYAAEDLCFCKGEDPEKEQYSGFEGKNPCGQSLGEVLELMEIRNVLICGIATEYCVRNTAEDLLKAGFKPTVLTDCIAYVDAQGHRDALEAMEKEGIHCL